MLMSRDTPPPRSLELPNANQLLAVDSGWSSVPPAPARIMGEGTSPLSSMNVSVASRSVVALDRSQPNDETASPIEESGVQRLATRRRADGTLLGVAPPQPAAPIRSGEWRPVVV